MSVLRSFRCLRPTPEKVAVVASVPYDVVNRAEAKQMSESNPLSFLRVSRAEVEFPESVSPYSDVVYQRASENFKYLAQACPFILEKERTLYIYRLRMKEHVQTGIVGSFSIDEYDSGIIKKHERTRPEKEGDRVRHIAELKAQTGPVYFAYRDVAEIDQEVEKIVSSKPLFDFTAADGVVHTVWSVPQSGKLVELFGSKVPSLYIADGHHRAAAASRVRAEFKKNHSGFTGQEDFNFVLAVAFPASQLQILPYHRIVKDLGSFSETEFLNLVQTRFVLNEGDRSIPERGQFGMYISDKWYRLRSLSSTGKKVLDVDVLQNSLLQPILGIADPRTDSRIDFVGGIRGTQELERLVQNGEAKVAFSLHPTQLSQVMDVSDRGEIMPPKSTWFEPKLRDGLFCHVFGEF